MYGVLQIDIEWCGVYIVVFHSDVWSHYGILQRMMWSIHHSTHHYGILKIDIEWCGVYITLHITLYHSILLIYPSTSLYTSLHQSFVAFKALSALHSLYHSTSSVYKVYLKPIYMCMYICIRVRLYWVGSQHQTVWHSISLYAQSTSLYITPHHSTSLYIPIYTPYHSIYSICRVI